jgi:hypothetical protein
MVHEFGLYIGANVCYSISLLQWYVYINIYNLYLTKKLELFIIFVWRSPIIYVILGYVVGYGLPVG